MGIPCRCICNVIKAFSLESSKYDNALSRQFANELHTFSFADIYDIAGSNVLAQFLEMNTKLGMFCLQF